MRRNKLLSTQLVSVLFLIWQHAWTSVSIFRSVNLKTKLYKIPSTYFVLLI